MNFEFFIALRYIRSKKKGVFVLLTSLIAVVGVTVGVAALIVTLSVMNGFKSDIQEKILGTQAQIIVMSKTDNKTDIPGMIEKLQKFPGVVSASPFVSGQGILKHGNSSMGVVVKGIDPAGEGRISNLNSKLTKGSLSTLVPNGNKNIILGRELARNLGVDMGDDVVLVSPHAIETPFGSVPQMGVFKVSGIFYIGMYEFDANLAYLSLDAAQKLFNLKDTVSGFGIKIKDIYEADEMAKRLPIFLNYDYWVRSWIQMNQNLFSALKLEKFVMSVILTLIILVAAFNIISNLFLLTMEKYRDIGVLRALGAKVTDIRRIFVIQGLITGIMGIAGGSFLGIGISVLLDKYRFIKLPADVYYIDTLPVKIVWSNIAMVIAMALLIAFIATLYPAQKAAKVDPVEAIRYG